jgi:excisionase family DNA binding protein
MSNRFASIPEVARLLVVSVTTVRRMIAARKFPIHRFGRQIRIDRHDLARFVEGTREVSFEEIDMGDDASGQS